MSEKAEKIRKLNDELRMRGHARNGKVVAVGALQQEISDTVKMAAIVTALSNYDKFSDGDDPYGEHDFGSFIVGDQELIFKIDYYALDEIHGSDHPEDPAVTIRILSVFYASDY